MIIPTDDGTYFQTMVDPRLSRVWRNAVTMSATTITR